MFLYIIYVAVIVNARALRQRLLDNLTNAWSIDDQELTQVSADVTFQNESPKEVGKRKKSKITGLGRECILRSNP